MRRDALGLDQAAEHLRFFLQKLCEFGLGAVDGFDVEFSQPGHHLGRFDGVGKLVADARHDGRWGAAGYEQACPLLGLAHQIGLSGPHADRWLARFSLSGLHLLKYKLVCAAFVCD